MSAPLVRLENSGVCKHAYRLLLTSLVILLPARFLTAQQTSIEDAVHAAVEMEEAGTADDFTGADDFEAD